MNLTSGARSGANRPSDALGHVCARNMRGISKCAECAEDRHTMSVAIMDKGGLHILVRELAQTDVRTDI